MVTIQAGDGGTFQAYLSLPSSGTGPGLVLMQEIFGVNQVMREVADEYAAHGFVVICPDLFWRQKPGIQLTDRTEEEWNRAFALYKGLDETLAAADSAASMEFLRTHPACTGKVGGVGYCLGGKLAYLLSARFQPDAAVGYYGVGIEKGLEDGKGISSPLMLHLAGRDQFCPPAAREAIQAKFKANPLITLHDYPEQDHAFCRRGGEHFSEAAAELANLRTLEFFIRHLGLGGATRGKTAGKTLSEKWDEHVKFEFDTRNTDDTLKTMVEDAYVNHIPTLTGGVGKGDLREFYSKRFIPKMPPDTSMVSVSRTIGADRVVDEMIFRFTHTMEMDWMLPGVAPTGKKVEVPLIAVVHFRDGKLAHEHIYWDQASVLVQLGLLDADKFPVAGVETARKVLDPKLPANTLIERADRRRQ